MIHRLHQLRGPASVAVVTEARFFVSIATGRGRFRRSFPNGFAPGGAWAQWWRNSWLLGGFCAGAGRTAPGAGGAGSAHGRAPSDPTGQALLVDALAVVAGQPCPIGSAADSRADAPRRGRGHHGAFLGAWPHGGICCGAGSRLARLMGKGWWWCTTLCGLDWPAAICRCWEPSWDAVWCLLIPGRCTPGSILPPVPFLWPSLQTAWRRRCGRLVD